jgi:hypothetical protein
MRVAGSLFRAPCDYEEIEKIIKNFKNDKASDNAITILKKCGPL